MIGWSGIQLILLYFFVPETFLPIILRREAKDKRIATGNGQWYAPSDRSKRKISDVFPAAIWVPVKMMLVERMALAMNLWTALVLGIIYLFFNAIPFTFRIIYGLYVHLLNLWLKLIESVATSSRPVSPSSQWDWG